MMDWGDTFFADYSLILRTLQGMVEKNKIHGQGKNSSQVQYV